MTLDNALVEISGETVNKIDEVFDCENLIGTDR